MNYNEIDLNLIKIFCTVYENKSILSASKKLYISQPAITNSIKRLETFLEGKVFVRTPKGIIPTAEGEAFYASCKKSLNSIDKAVGKFKSLSQFNKGFLNIGSSSTIMRKLLIPFLKKFNNEYPNIVITVTDADSETLEQKTLAGELDVSIINAPIETENAFNITKITSTTDCFVANAGFLREFVKKDELKDFPLIVQKRPSSNREYFEQMCIKNNVVLEPSFEIGSFGLINDFVADGFGIAYTVFDFVSEDIQRGRLKLLKTDFEIEPRDICAITPTISVNTLICEKFIEELKEFFN